MYVAVDLGGTKTLVGVFKKDGSLLSSQRFETPKNYGLFIRTLVQILKSIKHPIEKIAIAAPGRVNRNQGVVEGFGNLNWRNTPLKADIKKHFKVPIYIENDANLAGLSEAQFIINSFKKVLYVTISTGIGTGIITNGIIDPDFADSEGGQIPLEHNGKILAWEDFASGRSIQEKYGLLASQIDDPKIWQEITENIAIGIIDLIAIIQPDIIIIGGGAVSVHFDRLGPLLKKELRRYETPLLPIPPIRQAKRPEEAVLFGCYELMKQS